MSIVLLRTLTRKSLIGFGAYRDLTVQNLLDMARHKELLSIYYNFRNIDFNQDLIDELKIDKVYRIDKKQVQEERYIPNASRYIRLCLGLIIEENKDNLQKVRMKIASNEKKHNRNNRIVKDNMNTIKSRLQSKNQRSK
jgi:hypothetical protein